MRNLNVVALLRKAAQNSAVRNFALLFMLVIGFASCDKDELSDINVDIETNIDQEFNLPFEIFVTVEGDTIVINNNNHLDFTVNVDASSNDTISLVINNTTYNTINNDILNDIHINDTTAIVINNNVAVEVPVNVNITNENVNNNNNTNTNNNEFENNNVNNNNLEAVLSVYNEQNVLNQIDINNVLWAIQNNLIDTTATPIPTVDPEALLVHHRHLFIGEHSDITKTITESLIEGNGIITIPQNNYDVAVLGKTTEGTDHVNGEEIAEKIVFDVASMLTGETFQIKIRNKGYHSIYPIHHNDDRSWILDEDPLNRANPRSAYYFTYEIIYDGTDPRIISLKANADDWFIKLKKSHNAEGNAFSTLISEEAALNMIISVPQCFKKSAFMFRPIAAVIEELGFDIPDFE